MGYRTNQSFGIVCIFSCLWLLLCIGFTVDTNHFVYLSLSQTMVGGGIILLLAVIAMVVHLSFWRDMIQGRIQYIVLLWMTYLGCHALFLQKCELYKLLYWEETLLLLLILPFLLRRNLLGRRIMEDGVMLMTGLNLICLMLQSLGVVQSYNENFRMTGFCENPNVTAILIAVSMPLFFRRLVHSAHKWIWGLVIVLSVGFLLLLKCRTAYVGLFVIITVRMLLSPRFRTFWSALKKGGRAFVVVLMALLLLSGGLILYQSKQASADGRLLIWKVSAQMIHDEPLGVGVGLFEHDYQLAQAEYFDGGLSTAQERYHSGTVYMAYNDFIEHCVEVGIPGALFMLAFYLSIIVHSYKMRNMDDMSVILAFLAMSCTNFIYSSIQPWIVFLCYASFILADSVPDVSKLTSKSLFAGIAVTVVTVVLCLLHFPMVLSQMKLKHYHDCAQTGTMDIRNAERLASTIGTSEAYYRFMYRLYRERNVHSYALRSILEAKQYTSTPDVYFSLFDCYDALDSTAVGIKYMSQVRRMLPQNLTSRLVLLNWYDRNHDEEMAIALAHEIATMCVKVQNQRSTDIQNYARSYLEKHKQHNQE